MSATGQGREPLPRFRWGRSGGAARACSLAGRALPPGREGRRDAVRVGERGRRRSRSRSPAASACGWPSTRSARSEKLARKVGAGLDWSREAEDEAILWAQKKGDRSGRIAYQFACDFVGRRVMARGVR
ncbi:MAG TPA: DUF815 domain-containing protein [Anaeromyxobacter sp.]